MRKYMHPRFTEILEKMLIDELYYFTAFFSFVDFYEAPGLGTFGIGLKNLKLAMLYDPEFLMRQSDEQLKYLMIHELHHPLWRHTHRGGGRDKELSNQVQDCIINHVIDTQFGKDYTNSSGKKYTLASRPVVHEADFQDPQKAAGLAESGMKVGDETGCRLDQEYLDLVNKKEADLVFEPLYDWMKKNGKMGHKPFDVHLELSEADEEILARLTKEVHEKAKQISRGNGSAYIDEMLELMLKTPKRNNLREIRKACQTVRGFVKEASYRRPNRKVDGVKGHRKTGHAITVIHDWSGSMTGRHETVLSEMFRDGYELMFIGADVAVNRVFKVTHKEQLRRIPFHGGGGTELQPAVNYVLADSKLKRNPLVVLTDGMTDTLDFTGFGKVLILSTDKECPISAGNVKQIIVGDGV